MNDTAKMAGAIVIGAIVFLYLVAAGMGGGLKGLTNGS